MNWIDRLITNYCMIEWKHIEVWITIVSMLTVCWIIATAH
jgi:hypothetical protein